jgi:hypothetical protein
MISVGSFLRELNATVCFTFDDYPFLLYWREHYFLDLLHHLPVSGLHAILRFTKRSDL